MSKVLVVDDEPDVLKVIKARVESAGHDVTTAKNGAEALALTKKEKFDLIVTDVVMPEIDGFQLYKLLKQDPLTNSIPVLVLTARGKMEDTFRMIGADDFMSKPFEAESFIQKLNKLLGAKSVQKEIGPKTSAPPVAKPDADMKTGAKILVSGTNEGVIKKMTQLLHKAGLSVEEAVGGVDIIAKSNASQPNLILLDILMDDSKPEDLVSILRLSPPLKKTAILLYSYIDAAAGDDVQQKLLSIEAAKDPCLEAGATAHIGSFNERTFINSLAAYIKR